MDLNLDRTAPKGTRTMQGTSGPIRTADHARDQRTRLRTIGTIAIADRRTIGSIVDQR